MRPWLIDHWQVKCVYYPGLPSHPEHHIAKRQMTGFGGVVSFEVSICNHFHVLVWGCSSGSWILSAYCYLNLQVDGDLTTTIKFVDALKIPYIAPSFGGCESIVDQPAIMSYWYFPSFLSCSSINEYPCLALVSLNNHKTCTLGFTLSLLLGSDSFNWIVRAFQNRDLNQSERAKYGIQDNLVRFSFGVEDFEDLKADILQALESI